ncbi:peroxiredoxin [Bradyrhizobium canariense]|uniref:thioredoxin-dependent peroxiredoxin n=1 Tax=Bradyrhizobium canariense TaxID=255045 RepID=A0A1H1R1E9_9BRAD|nr:peroxiredoxin [Bradyrhizobium canariense]SDS29621.1 peroxiredoxin Q/BCP [Bradyrhizobium canariense]
MSKKTRKKSSKTSSGKLARAESAAAAEKPATKKRQTAAAIKSAKRTLKKTGKKTGKQPRNAVPAASHQAPSKRLKSPASKPAAAKFGNLAEGSKAPAFRLPRDGGETVSLSDFAGRKLVLFFYPRADTPGCTKEAIDFTRLAEAFAANQTAVLGVSADPLKAQESFRNKHQLSVPLASDEKHEMLEAYGAWGEKSMYGRSFLGVFRTTVLIGPDGRVVRIWRNVKVDGHADEVLAAVRAA